MKAILTATAVALALAAPAAADVVKSQSFQGFLGGAGSSASSALAGYSRSMSVQGMVGQNTGTARVTETCNRRCGGSVTAQTNGAVDNALISESESKSLGLAGGGAGGNLLGGASLSLKAWGW